MPPVAMFSTEHDALFERDSPTYGELDADGLPVETANGEPLSKSQRKKLAKQMAKQAKAHETYLESQLTGE